MKLIDADAINFEDMCDCCPSADCGDCPGPKGFASWLKKQPTAYDPDKIVEQLEDIKMRHFLTMANTGDDELDLAYEYVGNALDTAIEIVQSGGKV